MYRKINIARLLNRIANLDFQKDAWLNGKCPDSLADSFGEAINTLDDLYFFEDIKSGTLGKISQKELEIVRHFSNKLLIYEEPNDISELFDDNRWLAIMEDAKNIKKILLDSGYLENGGEQGDLFYF